MLISFNSHECNEFEMILYLASSKLFPLLNQSIYRGLCYVGEELK